MLLAWCSSFGLGFVAEVVCVGSVVGPGGPFDVGVRVAGLVSLRCAGTILLFLWVYWCVYRCGVGPGTCLSAGGAGAARLGRDQ